MGATDAKRLKALEDENRKIKQPVSESSVDKQGLKYLIKKVF